MGTIQAIARLFHGGGARKPAPKTAFASASECGPERDENQDCFFADAKRRVFCVADGMGGGQGGSRASATACAMIGEAVARPGSFRERIRSIGRAIDGANEGILRFAANAGYDRMGTTVALLAVGGPVGSGPATAVVAHVGDSRVYLFRKGSLVRLTRDHSLVEDSGVAFSPLLRRTNLSHVLTRAVGIERSVRPGWRKIAVCPGDMFLLCSDGVCDMVPDDSIRFAFAAGKTPGGVVKILERKTLMAGAMDNYTMIVAAVES